MDIGGNVVGAGQNVYDIYENGPSVSNVAGLVGNTVGLAGNVKSKCFTAGTQIVVGMGLAEDGTILYDTKNIEDIQVGDLVYSYDVSTGEAVQSEVTSTFVRESNHINYLTIEDEHGIIQTIETTDGHPFWVVTDNPDLGRTARSVVDENGVLLYHENLEPGLNGYWVEAKDLRVGDVFLGTNGELSTLTNIVRVEQSGGIAVFNFTVEGNHDYFILAKEYDYGQTCVLVHNAELYDTARRFMGRKEFKNVKKNGLVFDPDIARNGGIPATTTNISPVGADNIRDITGAKCADYFVDFDISDVQTLLRKTKSGNTEIVILESIPPEKIVFSGRVESTWPQGQ